jgi:hypothetical protein
MRRITLLRKIQLLNQVPSIAVAGAYFGRGGQGWPPRNRLETAAAQKEGVVAA